jgi:LPS-assembly protein
MLRLRLTFRDRLSIGKTFGIHGRPHPHYVTSIPRSSNSTYTLGGRSCFDEQTWNVQRFEAEARANFKVRQHVAG